MSTVAKISAVLLNIRALEFEADAIGFGASAHGASDAPSIAATKRRKPGLPRHVIDGAGWLAFVLRRPQAQS
jgi:hypothetical protein